MLYNVHERPPFWKWLTLSLQHVFAMFGASVLVPMLTGLPIAVALFTSGVGTLIYILCTRAKVPVYLGSSFAYIGVIIAVSGYDAVTNPTPNYGAVMTGLLTVGIVYVIVALIIRFVGTKWLDKLLPPVIIGPMIMIIGFGLAPTAISMSGLTSGGTWQQILVAFLTLAVVLVVIFLSKGFLKVIPFLIGIAAGFVFAIAFGIVDFEGLKTVARAPKEWFKIPEFMFLWFKNHKFTFLNSTFTLHQINFAVLITIAPLALVTISEHVGDHAVLSEITGNNFLQDPGLDKTLMGDGIATGVAALLGGPANTTYGENTSVVGMTKVASVWVTGGAAVIAILLSFSNLFTTLIGIIPAPVMGGVSLVLYGFIGGNGIRVLVKHQVDFSKFKNLIIVSVMLVLGLGGAVIPIPNFEVGGMALAAVIGILLNFILPDDDWREKRALKKQAQAEALEAEEVSEASLDNHQAEVAPPLDDDHEEQDTVKQPKKKHKK